MESLHFGTATRDITPRDPMWAHGYADRTQKSSGVREHLSLGCLAVANGETRVLLFAPGTGDRILEAILQRLEKE